MRRLYRLCAHLLPEGRNSSHSKSSVRTSFSISIGIWDIRNVRNLFCLRCQIEHPFECSQFPGDLVVAIGKRSHVQFVEDSVLVSGEQAGLTPGLARPYHGIWLQSRPSEPIPDFQRLGSQSKISSDNNANSATLGRTDRLVSFVKAGPHNMTPPSHFSSDKK